MIKSTAPGSKAQCLVSPHPPERLCVVSSSCGMCAGLPFLPSPPVPPERSTSTARGTLRANASRKSAAGDGPEALSQSPSAVGSPVTFFHLFQLHCWGCEGQGETPLPCLGALSFQALQTLVIYQVLEHGRPWLQHSGFFASVYSERINLLQAPECQVKAGRRPSKKNKKKNKTQRNVLLK